MEKTNNQDFFNLIEDGSNFQLELFEVYKSSIGLINNLKNRSKRYMSLLADVEVSLAEDISEIDSTFALLTKNIESFNEVINEKRKSFTSIFEQMIRSYDLANSKYESKEGQITKFLEARKQMLFLRALIRKYKFKINSLQLMNNALLSISEEFEQSRAEFKQNLIQLSTAMTKSIEQTDDLLKKIDSKVSDL